MSNHPSAQNSKPSDDHPSVEELERYHEGLLETDARVTIEKHIAGCLPCSRQIAFFETVASALAESSPKDIGQCPSDETLLDFLKDSLTKERRQPVSDHTNLCDSCALRIVELSKLVRKTARQSENTESPASGLSTPELIRRVRERSPQEIESAPRLSFRISRLTWNTRFAVAAMSAVALLAIAIILYNRFGAHNIANHAPPKIVAPQVIPNGPNHLQKFGAPIPH